MEKILDALKGLLPDEQVKSLQEAIQETLDDSKAELDAEFNEKLEQGFADFAQELKDAEEVAEKGYQEAYAMIQDLRNRLETQRIEFDKAIDEGYEEAYQMLVAERGKNENAEIELYKQYDDKLTEMRNYIVNKVNEFLQFKGQEIYEQARRDVMNDPRLAEDRVALEKVINTVSNYISDEDHALMVNNKLEEATRSLEQLKGKVTILEARNIKLSNDNTKLNESVRHASALLKEHSTQQLTEEKKERTAKALNAQGRGHTVTDKDRIVAEYKDADLGKKNDDPAVDRTLVESINPDLLRQMQVLSGVPKKAS